MSEPPTPQPTSQPTRIATAGLTLVLLIAGQMILLALPSATALGLLLMLIGGLVFIFLVVRPPAARLSTLARRAHFSMRGVLIVVAILLLGLTTATMIVFETVDRTDYTPVLSMWITGLVVLALAFSEGRTFAVRPWLREHRRELLWLGAVTLLAAVLRLVQLGALPRVINGDEGRIGQFAVLSTKGNPLANPWSLFENIGGLYMQGIALAVKLFGQTAFSLRLLPALAGVLAIPALYLFARSLFGQRVALLAAFMLAVSHAQIQFSRTVAVSYIQGTLLMPLELYCFIVGLQKRDPLRLTIGGIILAFHFNIYLGAQIMIGLLLIYPLIAAILKRPIMRKAWRLLLVFWFSFVLAALPQIAFNVRHPNEFLARLNNGGTFQGNWLAQEAARQGVSQVQVLLERVSHAFLTLNQVPAIEFYGTSWPMLGIITGGLFILGAIYALVHTRDYRYLLLNGWFWSLTVAVGVFALPPNSDSYRMLLAIPAAMTMAAVALDQVLTAIASVAWQPRTATLGVAAFFLISMAVFNVRLYFVDFLPNCRYGGDTQTRFASYLGSYVGTLDRETTVYLLSNDNLRYGTHPSVDYLSRNRTIQNVDASITTIQPEVNTAIIAIPPRVDELRQWARAHPGGQVHEEYDCGKVMLLSYWLPTGESATP